MNVKTRSRVSHGSATSTASSLSLETPGAGWGDTEQGFFQDRRYEGRNELMNLELVNGRTLDSKGDVSVR
jgi:hypothetical protein